MTKTIVPVILNFIFPGVGLLWIGRFFDGVLNALIALLAPLMWLLTSNGADSVHYVMLAIAAGSAGYAHAVASRKPEAA